MPIDDLQLAAQKIAGFLTNLNKLGGFRLKFRITAGDGARDPQGLEGRVIYVEPRRSRYTLVTQHNGELLLRSKPLRHRCCASSTASTI